MDNLAESNRTFLSLVLWSNVTGNIFTKSVIESLNEPTECPLIHNHRSTGRILIDSTAVKSSAKKFKTSLKRFEEYVRRGMFIDVGLKIPRAIQGDLNTDATIVKGDYTFSFKIEGYEKNDGAIVWTYDDIEITEDEELVRLVSLTIAHSGTNTVN